MATQTIGTAGTRVKLLVRQGATFGPYLIEVRTPEGDPVNLTGGDFRAQIRQKALDADPVVATLTCAIVNAIGDAEDPATVSYGMTDAVTAAIPAGENPTDTASAYVWDMEWEDASGNVRPVAYGPVTVHREVTRT